MTHLILFIIIGYRLYIITYISHCHISNINLCQNTKPFKDGAYCTVNCTVCHGICLVSCTRHIPLHPWFLQYAEFWLVFGTMLEKLETFQLCSLQTFNRCLFTHFVHAARANFLNLFAGGENTVHAYLILFLSVQICHYVFNNVYEVYVQSYHCPNVLI